MIPRRFLIGLPGLFLAAWMAAGQTLPAPLVIVLIGPPASGKSTQAGYLNKKYKLPIISIEELVAERMGEDAKGQDLHRGDPAISGMLREHLRVSDYRHGFVLDGYPATREQAGFLDELVQEMELPRPIVVQIHVKDQVSHERSAKRGGPDDNPEIIAMRLREYHQEMDMLRSYYPEADIWTIDGTRPVRGVSATIRLLIEDRLE